MFAKLFITIIALLHIYILVLEMFLWEKPIGRKAFANTAEQAKVTKVLAQNMGLYNGFLAAGLLWSLFAGAMLSYAVANFFLGCVLVAGVYGALTASRKILYIQAIPALIALILLNLGV